MPIEFPYPSIEAYSGAVSDAAAQSRVLFLFPDSSEIRYTRKPKPGDRVRSEKGDIWTVGEVMRSGIDTYTVACVAPSPGVRKLAFDLLELARESISPSRPAAADSPADPSIDVRLRSEDDYGPTMQVPTDQRMTDGPENDYGRTMQVTTDQRVTDGPDWVVPPDVPTALDDSDDGAATGRDQENHASVDVRRAFLRLPPAEGANQQSSGKSIDGSALEQARKWPDDFRGFGIAIKTSRKSGESESSTTA